MVPSIEKKKQLSDKDVKRKELYLRICADWTEAITQAIKKEVERGTLDRHVKYTATRGTDHVYMQHE